MPKYNDADALRKEFSERPPDYYSTGYILDTIDELPALSPDEVRGVGKWLDAPYAIECSKCHEEFDSEVACCDIYGWPWKFCPKCGARMTEVSEYV